MTLEELRQRLSQIEWTDIEFKRAQREVPRNAYETVSAFANTTGGHLVFGIEEADGRFEILGVLDPDKVQNDFLSALRTGDLLSCVITAEESRIQDGDKVVLAFFIPEARREQKPVHLNGELKKSFIRRAAGDERCNEEEIKRFIRDADQRSYDSEAIPNFVPATCFDPESIGWYRTIFHRRNPGHETEGQSDQQFLDYFGLLSVEGTEHRATRAAVLLFGTASAMQRLMARPVVDIRLLLASADEVLPEERWDHRILLEENLTKCWRRGVQFFMDRVADRPFSIDTGTLHGSDAPPDYLAFREAFLNLLTHQDFGDQSRKAVITVHRDQLQFWNPGASFVCGDALFSPGDKPVRNPRVRAMLQRVGIGEQAGTGVRAIYGNQRRLGRIPPMLLNDRADQSFQVTLSKKLMATHRQQWVVQRFGANLSDAEAAVFLQSLRQEAIGPLEAASVSGLNPSETGKLLERLVQQQLLEIHPGGQGRSFRPKPIFAARAQELSTLPGTTGAFGAVAVPGGLVTGGGDQAASNANSQPSTGSPELAERLPETASAILAFCRAAQGGLAIMDKVGVSHRTFFKKKHLDPLIRLGFLRPTHPDKPRHPDQGYITTDAGKIMLESLVTRQGTQDAPSLVTDELTKPRPANP